MPFTRADLLSAAQQSLEAAGARDRDKWIGLFTADGAVEDPVGSRPHRGHVAIGHFYDTFIGPREITYRPEQDLVVGNTVLRDVELQIGMADTLTMRVPTYIRYDLRDEGADLKVAGLSAYWELPAMIGLYARGGLGALPAGIALGRAMVANQGLSGSLGVLSGFKGTFTGAKGLFGRFLDEACGGDEIGVRRITANASITHCDDDPLTSSDLVKQLSGGTWSKHIRSGRALAARIDRDGRRCVVIGDLAPDRAVLTKIRVFGELS